MPSSESTLLCTRNDVTITYECKQSTTTWRTHVKKNFQVNTFHDDFKAWMDFYSHCVCQWSYLEYEFSIYKVKLRQSNRESPWRSWCYLICMITRGLCSSNAWLFNDDVTAIGFSYWRRREFPNYARLQHDRMLPLSVMHMWSSVQRFGSFSKAIPVTSQQQCSIVFNCSFVLSVG